MTKTSLIAAASEFCSPASTSLTSPASPSPRGIEAESVSSSSLRAFGFMRACGFSVTDVRSPSLWA